MSRTDIHKTVLREYEKDRAEAKRLYDERLEEVYACIPRIREIDELLTKTGIAAVKAVLNRTGGRSELVSELKAKNQMLIDEKTALLKDVGFGGNYLTDIYKCSVCRDTGYIGSKKCKCFNKRLIDKAYDMSNIKQVLAYENFDTFDLRYYSNTVDKRAGKSPRQKMEAILQTCLDFVKYFDSVCSNLFLYGKSGLGKTFLCNCIAKDLLDKGKSVFYVTAIELFKMIERDRFDRDGDEKHNEMLDLLYDVDLLIIDDLGTEFQTILSSSELFDIINTRFLKKRSVVISTNLSPENLINKYSDRVVSRFYGNYDFLEFFGEDIRILKLTKGHTIE